MPGFKAPISSVMPIISAAFDVAVATTSTNGMPSATSSVIAWVMLNFTSPVKI